MLLSGGSVKSVFHEQFSLQSQKKVKKMTEFMRKAFTS